MFTPGFALGVFRLQPTATLGLFYSLPRIMDLSHQNQQAAWPSAFLFGHGNPSRSGREETEIFISPGRSPSRSPRLAILPTQVSPTLSSRPLCPPQAAALLLADSPQPAQAFAVPTLDTPYNVFVICFLTPTSLCQGALIRAVVATTRGESSVASIFTLHNSCSNPDEGNQSDRC